MKTIISKKKKKKEIRKAKNIIIEKCLISLKVIYGKLGIPLNQSWMLAIIKNLLNLLCSIIRNI